MAVASKDKGLRHLVGKIILGEQMVLCNTKDGDYLVRSLPKRRKGVPLSITWAENVELYKRLSSVWRSLSPRNRYKWVLYRKLIKGTGQGSRSPQRGNILGRYKSRSGITPDERTLFISRNMIAYQCGLDIPLLDSPLGDPAVPAPRLRNIRYLDGKILFDIWIGKNMVPTVPPPKSYFLRVAGEFLGTYKMGSMEKILKIIDRIDLKKRKEQKGDWEEVIEFSLDRICVEYIDGTKREVIFSERDCGRVTVQADILATFRDNRAPVISAPSNPLRIYIGGNLDNVDKFDRRDVERCILKRARNMAVKSGRQKKGGKKRMPVTAGHCRYKKKT